MFLQSAFGSILDTIKKDKPLAKGGESDVEEFSEERPRPRRVCVNSRFGSYCDYHNPFCPWSSHWQRI